MKVTSYKAAIAWLATNGLKHDSFNALVASEGVAVVAHMFGKDTSKVASDVIGARADTHAKGKSK